MSMSHSETLTSSMEEESYINTVGLGYGIAIAVGILVLVSSIMLASYVCIRVHGRRRRRTRRGGGGDEVNIEGNPSAETSHRAISMGNRARDGADGEMELTLEEGGGGNTPTFGGHIRGDCTIGGLDEATLDRYPKFKYMSSNKKKKVFNGIHACDNDHNDDDDDDDNGDSSCSICLADYCDGELIRKLPDCRHQFHTSCVDAWLRMHASCPICRTISPLPTPGSTPLSLLIPMARSPLESLYR